jgi:hypothetical protein
MFLGKTKKIKHAFFFFDNSVFTKSFFLANPFFPFNRKIKIFESTRANLIGMLN